MVTKAIGRIGCGKAAGSLDRLDTRACWGSLHGQCVLLLISCILIDWQDSYIVSLYTCKDDLNRGKYRSMGACSLFELVMKVLKSVMKGRTSQRVEIDQIQA